MGTRPRPPEDGWPRTIPYAYKEENNAIRWEIPVVVDGIKGTLVIRWFGDDEKIETSIRGQAVEKIRRRHR